MRNKSLGIVKSRSAMSMSMDWYGKIEKCDVE